MAFVALLVVYVSHSRSAKFSSEAVHDEAGAKFPTGWFDLETWHCQLKDMGVTAYVSSRGSRDYGDQCGFAKNTRVLLVPLVILSFFAAALSIKKEQNEDKATPVEMIRENRMPRALV